MSISTKGGIIAAGHRETARAAAHILAAGGNAFDAALAALLAAGVCEPVLTSLGGGGFMTAFTAEGEALVYDFFVQTPRSRRPLPEADYVKGCIDFGEKQQVQFIGRASEAVPGCPAGIARIHRAHGSLSLEQIAAPAIALARQGVTITPYQEYSLSILEPILKHSAEMRQVFAPRGSLLKRGDRLLQPALANSMEYLAREGFERFYEGYFARRLVEAHQREGGNFCQDDLSAYHLLARQPLRLPFRGHELLLNPLPSQGGSMIGYGLMAKAQMPLYPPPGGEYVQQLVQVFRQMEYFRLAHLNKDFREGAWPPAKVALALQQLAAGRQDLLGNTTHFSVMDRRGNAVGITSSLGGLSGHAIPGTGISMNNMLGELDLVPHGYESWPLNTRAVSMMSPTVVLKNGAARMVLGTGGSSRIRTAIVQVLSLLIEHELPLKAAVDHPRLHWEAGVLNLEPGLAPEGYPADAFTQHIDRWERKNMFFGGVHSVAVRQDGSLVAAADARRDGAVAETP
ncbi:MAG: gamma-glutamyltransferase [Bacteroidetes bacterium]|nr:MAG: gamma-glutamyltransferase [Bacteroidota bacterium]